MSNLMKQILAMILMLAVTCQIALADNCDYSKIVDNGNGTYTYSKQLNLCVGNMVKDLNAANQQVLAYQQAISLKDLALTDASKQATTWRDTSFGLQDKLTAIDTIESRNKIIYFTLGILVSGMAVYGASALARH